MKVVELEPTGTIVVFEGVHCRLWQGKTDRGVRVEMLVARVATTSSDPRELARIEDDLVAALPPAVDWPAMLALYEPSRSVQMYEDVEDDGPNDDDDD